MWKLNAEKRTIVKKKEKEGALSGEAVESNVSGSKDKRGKERSYEGKKKKKRAKIPKKKKIKV